MATRAARTEKDSHKESATGRDVEDVGEGEWRLRTRLDGLYRAGTSWRCDSGIFVDRVATPNSRRSASGPCFSKRQGTEIALMFREIGPCESV